MLTFKSLPGMSVHVLPQRSAQPELFAAYGAGVFLLLSVQRFVRI